MPELPEVETMVRGLRPVLSGRRLKRIDVLDELLLEGCERADLERAGRGTTVGGVERRGKWVVVRLAGCAGVIVIQPRMTGGFWLVRPPREDHVRVIFEVVGRGEPVWFCDTRRLGRVSWLADANSAEQRFARSHGPDALQISAAALRDRLRRTTRAIKVALMDQKVLAGIGNIYADEVLFRAGLNPQRNANSLRRRELSELHGALGEVLNEAIAAEGSSFDAGYRTVLGLEGGFLAQNAVYGREGEACRRCGSAILRTRFPGLVGRSTYYCPRCQPFRTDFR